VQRIKLPPRAPALVESIRSIGYTPETAVADILDNSVSAGAARIVIRFSPFDDPYIAILDDGIGMDSDQLTAAMRHGGLSPRADRSKDDLGRFGLGLKTASLSQCRSLTVISSLGGCISARRWDIDVIIEEEDWVLLDLDKDDLADTPLLTELCDQPSGTLVVWTNLDRIIGDDTSVSRALGRKMDTVRDHLRLVFHRYLVGESPLRKLQIELNGNLLTPLDPFLSMNPATTILPDQPIRVDGQVIQVKPYILPHFSKLSSDDLREVGPLEGMRNQQGFYVYRNRRLIVWGTWFRLLPQEELAKLARVRVDIPNTLDHLWTLDIKKSSAFPPESVRQALKQIVERIAGTSRRVITFRGEKHASRDTISIWDRLEIREGVSYKINRDHPLVQSLAASRHSFTYHFLDILLTTLESTIPINAIYADMAADRKLDCISDEMRNALWELAQGLVAVAASTQEGKDRILNKILFMEPFSLYPEATLTIVEALRNEH